jgi:hypothetical protein
MYAGFAGAKTGNRSRSAQDGQQGKQDREVIFGQPLSAKHFKNLTHL